MLRIILFLATNIGVLVLLAIIFRLFGIEDLLVQQGTEINLTGLLIFSAAFGMLGSFISLAMSKWIALKSTRAQVITQPASEVERWLVDVVKRQAASAGIGMPDVAIYAAPEMNAFATGMKRNSALVAVSTGLLEGMSRAEVEAVLAHEVSHVANGDMVTMGLLQGVLNTFVIFFARIIGLVVDRVVFRNERGYGIGYFAVYMLAQFVLGILASMIAMWFSRKREFRADQGSAQLEGADKMIQALKALQRSHRPSTLPASVQAFGINGGILSGARRLLMSHPPLEERIAALQQGR